MQVKIKWPLHRQADRPVRTPDVGSAVGKFVAFGRAGDEVRAITWRCHLIGDSRVQGHANSLTFFPHTDSEYGKNRWSITMRVPRAGNYLLTVIGHTPDGDTAPAVAEFSVEFIPFEQLRSSVEDLEVVAVTIGWPGNNELLNDYKDDFAPYGYLSGATLDFVRLFVGMTPTLPLTQYGDPIELEFWTAQFDSLDDTQTYVLRAQDGLGLFQERSNLHF